MKGRREWVLRRLERREFEHRGKTGNSDCFNAEGAEVARTPGRVGG
jgi:hypothetical protein